MKLILMGIQGSGKGTQAKMICEKYKIPHLSVGEMLREEVAKKSQIGLKVKEIIDMGNLVSDEITISLVKARIEGEKGFLLDGFPRTINQAKALDNITKIDHVILIDLSDEEAKKRIGKRIECVKCGTIYSENFYKKEDCEKCGGKLQRRADDNDEAIAKRIGIFHEMTKPLLDFYANKKILRKINGEKSISAVFSDIVQVLEKNQ